MEVSTDNVKVEYSPIQEFYQDCSVLVTGGTGFCGKVLVEKLLRSCPEIRNIFLLMRPKNDQLVSERLTKLLQEPLFEHLKLKPQAMGGDIFQKVIAVPGDVSKPGLGLSIPDREQLIREVSVVFHVAATVKFNENLKVALQTNVIGAQEIVLLCKEMDHLKALVYVSTAYSQCPMQEIQEKVYPPPLDPDILYECASWMTAEEFSIIEHLFLDKWPNTYSFSKAVAENVMQRNCCTLPIAIIRPSIVISTWREPIPGWIDNTNGPTLGIIGTGAGMIRCGFVDKCKVADLVPVDMVVNALIAVAWRTSSDWNGLKVYNLVSSVQQPITWGKYFEMCKEHTLCQPPSRTVWYYFLILSRNKHVYRVLSFWLEFLPACIMDIIPYMMTGKHRNIDTYFKAEKFLQLVSFFATRDWKFQDDNVRRLLNDMTPVDRSVFCFDLKQLNWTEYLLHYIVGVRKYLLKEDPETIPAARKRYKYLFILHVLFQCGITYLSYKLIWKKLISHMISKLWQL